MENSITKRLDGLRDLIQTREFLKGEGLSNEVNIRIFCYDSSDEMAVRSFVDQLASDQNLSCRLMIHDLYDVFLSICEDLDILEAIPDMEETDGSTFLLEQLHSAIGESEFIQKMKKAPPQANNVLMLTGVGEVFPFMRIHTLLEALQPHFPDTPIIVLYPGTFDGHHVKLFDRLKPNDYYRAFNIL